MRARASTAPEAWQALGIALSMLAVWWVLVVALARSLYVLLAGLVKGLARIVF